MFKCLFFGHKWVELTKDEFTSFIVAPRCERGERIFSRYNKYEYCPRCEKGRMSNGKDTLGNFETREKRNSYHD